MYVREIRYVVLWTKHNRIFRIFWMWFLVSSVSFVQFLHIVWNYAVATCCHFTVHVNKSKELSFPNPCPESIRRISGGERSISRSGRFTFGKELPYPLCTRLCGHQGRCGGENEFLYLRGFESRTIQMVWLSLYCLRNSIYYSYEYCKT
jgi:hypothetical protein